VQRSGNRCNAELVQRSAPAAGRTDESGATRREAGSVSMATLPDFGVEHLGGRVDHGHSCPLVSFASFRL